MSRLHRAIDGAHRVEQRRVVVEGGEEDGGGAVVLLVARGAVALAEGPGEAWRGRRGRGLRLAATQASYSPP
jgi:hypothetical protein